MPVDKSLSSKKKVFSFNIYLRILAFLSKEYSSQIDYIFHLRNYIPQVSIIDMNRSFLNYRSYYYSRKKIDSQW